MLLKCAESCVRRPAASAWLCRPQVPRPHQPGNEGYGAQSTPPRTAVPSGGTAMRRARDDPWARCLASALPNALPKRSSAAGGTQRREVLTPCRAACGRGCGCGWLQWMHKIIQAKVDESQGWATTWREKQLQKYKTAKRSSDADRRTSGFPGADYEPGQGGGRTSAMCVLCAGVCDTNHAHTHAHTHTHTVLRHVRPVTAPTVQSTCWHPCGPAAHPCRCTANPNAARALQRTQLCVGCALAKLYRCRSS